MHQQRYGGGAGGGAGAGGGGGGGGMRMPAPSPASRSLLDDFAREMSRLGNYAHKNIINALTMLAQDSEFMAADICALVERQLYRVQPASKVPILFLLDSLVKNGGHAYVEAFGRNIVNAFLDAFRQVSPKDRERLVRLVRTWETTRCFPAPLVTALHGGMADIRHREEAAAAVAAAEQRAAERAEQERAAAAQRQAHPHHARTSEWRNDTNDPRSFKRQRLDPRSAYPGAPPPPQQPLPPPPAPPSSYTAPSYTMPDYSGDTTGAWAPRRAPPPHALHDPYGRRDPREMRAPPPGRQWEAPGQPRQPYPGYHGYSDGPAPPPGVHGGDRGRDRGWREPPRHSGADGWREPPPHGGPPHGPHGPHGGGGGGGGGGARWEERRGPQWHGRAITGPPPRQHHPHHHPGMQQPPPPSYNGGDLRRPRKRQRNRRSRNGSSKDGSDADRDSAARGSSSSGSGGGRRGDSKPPKPAARTDFRDLAVVSDPPAAFTLYGAVPESGRCETCGVRFKSSSKLKSHMDWHFQRNQEARSGGIQCQAWYDTVEEWVDAGSSSPDKVKATSFFALQEMQEKEKAKAEEQAKAQVVVVDDRYSVCPVCGEKFGKSFDDELDDWVYVHAVRLGDGRIVHTACAGALQDNSVKSEHR